MAHSFPAVLQVFYVRLRSSTSEERLHAAQALLGVVEKEPGLLDPRQLREALLGLKQINDKDAMPSLRKAISKIKGLPRTKGCRYGL
jgi:hypothetical protein